MRIKILFCVLLIDVKWELILNCKLVMKTEQVKRIQPVKAQFNRLVYVLSLQSQLFKCFFWLRELYLDYFGQEKCSDYFQIFINTGFIWQLVPQFLLLCHTQKGLRQIVWKVNRKKTGTRMSHANLAALQWDPKERWLQVHLWVQKERNQLQFPV